MSKIQLRPLSPVFGAEVRGVNLAAGLNDDTFAEIHQAFLDYGVLFFKDQPAPMDEATQIAFGRRFGPLHIHPAAPGSGEDDAIFVIHAHRDSKVANGNGWHTDVSCDEQPPMATMLQLRLLPEGGGGDTMFANMEAAYAVLSDDDRQFLRGLSANHTSEHIFRGRYADRGVDDSDRASYPAAVHPVVRTHPETGRPSIYVNRAFTTSIDGMDTEEGHRLLGRLLDHVERPEFQIRFSWEQNDVALWDNRCLQHYALWDYWPNERLGHRVTVLGDRPSFDPAAPEPERSSIRVRIESIRPRVDAAVA
ncbi:MAG: TauD/TfdA family dioxygenase [Acidimicrobiales bacterium]